MNQKSETASQRPTGLLCFCSGASAGDQPIENSNNNHCVAHTKICVTILNSTYVFQRQKAHIFIYN